MPPRSDLTYPRVIVRKGRRVRHRWFGYIRLTPDTTITGPGPALPHQTPQEAAAAVLNSRKWQLVQPITPEPVQEPTA